MKTLAQEEQQFVTFLFVSGQRRQHLGECFQQPRTGSLLRPVPLAPMTVARCLTNHLRLAILTRIIIWPQDPILAFDSDEYTSSSSLIPAAGQRNVLSFSAQRLTQAPHWFHPPLPPCGRDDAPHQANWIQNRTGVHAHQRSGELRSVKKWQPEGGRKGRMCQRASWMWLSLSLLLVSLSSMSHKQEGCSLSFDFDFCL